MKRILFFAFMCLSFADLQSQMADFRPINMEPAAKWVSLPGGVNLNYFEQGTRIGLSVILLHGYTDSYHSFDSILPYLKDGLHVYAITLRGFGDSDKPADEYDPEIMARDVSQFMDVLNIESAVLIGHSMGSAVAQKFALDYPGKTKALVLMSSFINFSRNPVVKELIGAINEMKTVDQEFAKAFQRSTFEKMIDSNYFKLLVGESMKAPIHVWKFVMKGFQPTDYSNELVRIVIPSLILWGDKDKVSTIEDQTELHEKLKQSSFIRYHNIGHAPHWEQPERVANDINAFLEKHK